MAQGPLFTAMKENYKKICEGNTVESHEGCRSDNNNGGLGKTIREFVQENNSNQFNGKQIPKAEESIKKSKNVITRDELEAIVSENLKEILSIVADIINNYNDLDKELTK